MNGTDTHTHTDRHTHTLCPACSLSCRYGAEDQEWVLLYRASRDGYRAQDFHRYCDAQGPSMIIVKVQLSVSTCGLLTNISLLCIQL